MASSVEQKPHQQSHITIKVQNQDAYEVYFRVRKDAPLHKLMRAYCDVVGLDDIEMVRFFIDGKRLKGVQTPKDLQMNDGDVVDAFLDQIAGGGGGGRGCGNNIG